MTTRVKVTALHLPTHPVEVTIFNPGDPDSDRQAGVLRAEGDSVEVTLYDTQECQLREVPGA